MKQAAAIFLLLCISYQFVAKVGVIAVFKANQQYIAQNHCENKDKPKLHCNGKCYLKKQLAKIEDNTEKQQPAQPKKAKAEFTDFLAIIPQASSIGIIHIEAKTQCTVYINHYSFRALNDCFHPPANETV